MSPVDAELHGAVEQLLDDIEAMIAGPDEYGEFSEWRLHDDGFAVVVSWPNLRISADRLRAALGAVDRMNGPTAG